MKTFLVLIAILLTACDDGDPAAPSQPVVKTCSPPKGASIAKFDSDGAMLWMPGMIAGDGSVTLRLCDGEILRAVRVTGLSAGEAVDGQAGVMTDGNRRIVHAKDLITTVSDMPVATPRLEGVTVQCIPLLGSCEPAPAPPAPEPEEAVPAVAPAAPAPAAQTVTPPAAQQTTVPPAPAGY